MTVNRLYTAEEAVDIVMGELQPTLERLRDTARRLKNTEDQDKQLARAAALGSADGVNTAIRQLLARFGVDPDVARPAPPAEPLYVPANRGRHHWHGAR